MLKSQHSHGFTLVELMITLAVVAIVVSIAAPSMGQFIRENRAATQANNFLASLQLARSEAINRGIQVTMRRTSTTPSNWNEGWTVFSDWNADGVFDGDADEKDCSVEGQDCLLTVQPALPGGMTINSGGTLTIGLTFLPSGEVRRAGGGFVNDTFTLCAPMTNQRRIVISGGGRARVQEMGVPCP